MHLDRRELVLIAASAMFMLGLSPFVGIAYALVITLLIYFGVRVFVGRRRMAQAGGGSRHE